MEQYVLALDQGTTSSRAVLFNKKGNPVSSAQHEFKQYYTKAGWAEHDPEELFLSQIQAVSDALVAAKINPSNIAAIGIANQRETTLVWERETGKPIYNAIVWQCRRTADLCEKLKAQGLEEYVAEKTGLLIDAYFSGTKLQWILDNIPGARLKADQGKLLFGTVETFLIWRLTGEKVHATDYSNASRTMLFDINSLSYDSALLRAMNIPSPLLPEPRPSSQIYGTVSKSIKGLEALAGIPIAAALGDQQAALFGQACLSAGQAKNTYGTGCFLMMHTGSKPIRSRTRLLTTIAWGLSEKKAEYALEGSVFNAGSIIKWLRDDLGIIKHAAEVSALAQSVPDALGAYLVPAFTGLGAPFWDMYARGALVGLTRGFTRAHFARAALEAIAYQVADLAEAIQADTGLTLTDLKADGGASVSDMLMQFQADILNCSIHRPKSIESTALGAAYAAGLAVGLWRDKNETAANYEAERVFTPQMTEAERKAKKGGWSRAVQRSLNWEQT